MRSGTLVQQSLWRPMCMEASMLTNWISKETLAGLNDGFVVAIMLEAKDGEGDAVAEIARRLTPPSMAEPGVKLFLPYRSPTNPSLFFIFELYVNEAAWKAHESTDHFKTLVPELVSKLKRRERVPFVPFL
jgi:(4S)-4-hydroxy-5-phosphonooxypentane-2,3-dione isomerase